MKGEPGTPKTTGLSHDTTDKGRFAYLGQFRYRKAYQITCHHTSLGMLLYSHVEGIIHSQKSCTVQHLHLVKRLNKKTFC